MAFSQWWDTIDGAMKLFYGVAFLATFIMALQTLLTLIGWDADHDFGAHHGDLLSGGEGASDVSVLSVRSILAFFVGFGWTGAIFGELGWALWLVLPLALGVGGCLMLLVFWVMRGIYDLRQSGSLDYVYAIGETGSVYLPIPPRKSKAGKIEVLVQGRLAIVDAYTHEERTIGNREKVRVIDVVGTDALLVEALNTE